MCDLLRLWLFVDLQVLVCYKAGMITFFRWLGERPNLTMGVGMSFVMLMSNLVAYVVLDLVVQHPIEDKTRYLVLFVTGLVGAFVFGCGHGVLMGRYGKAVADR